MYALSVALFLAAASCVGVALLGGQPTMLVIASITFFIALLLFEQHGRRVEV